MFFVNNSQAQQFLTIVKYMNLSQAAKELYISQPALSLALSRLEKELGVRLFYRDGNKLVLSPGGEELYNYFKDLRDAHQNLIDKAESMRVKKDEVINIGFAGSVFQFGAMYMSNYLGTFEGTVIQKVYGSPNLLAQLLLAKQLEFAITCPPLRHEQLSSLNIASEEMVVIVASGHRLAGQESVQLSELKTERLYGMRRQHKLRMTVDELCFQHGFTPVYAKEFDYDDYFEAVSKEAGGTEFIAICPISSFGSTYQDGYRMLRVSDCKLERITTLSWLTERKVNYQYKGLVDMIQSTYQKQTAFHADYVGWMSKLSGASMD